MEGGDLALAVVQDVAAVGGRVAGGGDLVPDLDVLGDDLLQPPPVLVDVVLVVLVVAGVLQLPGFEPGPVHGERHRAEQLDVGGVAVEHGGREDGVVADRGALMIQGLAQPGEHALVRDDHHGVAVEHEVGAEPAVLDVLRRGVLRVQVGGVVVLVERVDDDLPVDRHVPGQLVGQPHVLHPVHAEVGHDLRAEPVEQRRGGARPGQHGPHPAGPFGALHGRRGQPGQRGRVEVLPVRDADDRALQVVHPVVPAAAEPAGAPGRLAHDARAAVLADVVEPAHATVAAPGEDDRLALPGPGDEVARVGELGRAADDLPARREHRGPLALVALGVGVDAGVQEARADVRDRRHIRAEPGRRVAAGGSEDHAAHHDMTTVI